MFFNQQLQEKKEKLEELLARIIVESNTIAEMNERNANIGRTARLQDLDLIIECLQGGIDQLDAELRREASPEKK